MKVSQLAQQMQVTADTVRHYTRLGLLKPGRDHTNGYKCYGPRDVKRLHFIIRAKQLGFTLNEIRQIVSMGEQGETPCPLVRKLVRERLERAKQELEEVQQLYGYLQNAIELWQEMPDQEPTGDMICALIESWDEPVKTVMNTYALGDLT